jgi:hypothetical protein
MSTADGLLKNADPLIASALNRALSEKEVTPDEAAILYGAKGLDFHLVGMVADELRRRRVGDIVTFVVNRNINFTNVCIKQCGFCAFSRDFRAARKGGPQSWRHRGLHTGRAPTGHGRRAIREDLQGNQVRDS